MGSTQRFDDVGECTDAILRRIGSSIVLATPLGIGKPNALLNEIYRRAARDPSIRLEIVTALSLNRPEGRSDVERRFLQPLAERLYGDYPDLDYLKAIRAGKVPANIRIHEFFVAAGEWIKVDSVQQQYVSINYSDVVEELVDRGVNVLVQSLACRTLAGREQLSLSSNPDLSVDLLNHFKSARSVGRPVLAVGSINRQMPFMLGDAVLDDGEFDVLLDHARYQHEPFAIPNAPIRDTEHAIGLNVAALIRDGGTLQIGIGELGEACVYSIGLRQHRNDVFRHALGMSGATQRFSTEIEEIGGSAPLERGIYACTEMFSPGLLELFRSGVLSRRVYPHATLQRLLDDELITTKPDVETLVALWRAGVSRLDRTQFAALLAAGLFLPGTRHEDDFTIVAPDGTRIAGFLDDAQARDQLSRHCLAKHLDGGRVLHGAFLLGTRAFYASLRNLPEDDRLRFEMKPVRHTNTLYGPDFELKVAQRRNARFINSTMMVTGLGAAVSDTLDNGQVVSGVGGQMDFVTQAHTLPGARSILMLRATRLADGRDVSNLVWNYPQTTVPRQLRDIVVTEYGIAALKGRSDSDCVKAILAVTDSRFQTELLAAAKGAGKIDRSYRIPDEHRHNYPEKIRDVFRPLRAQGLFSEFPFGCDYTHEEVVLLRALTSLKRRRSGSKDRALQVARAFLSPADRTDLDPYLSRLGFEAPRNWRDSIAQRLVASAIAEALRDD